MRFRRQGDGYAVKLSGWEKSLLTSLLPQLRELLVGGESPNIRRLFPPAHADDADADADYQAMVHDELLEQRLVAIDTIESTLEARHLSPDEASRWMHAINSIRLVLGTRLDVGTEDVAVDEDDPDLPLWAAYDVLTAMLARIVDAMSPA